MDTVPKDQSAQHVFLLAVGVNIIFKPLQEIFKWLKKRGKLQDNSCSIQLLIEDIAFWYLIPLINIKCLKLETTFYLLIMILWKLLDVYGSNSQVGADFNGNIYDNVALLAFLNASG